MVKRTLMPQERRIFFINLVTYLARVFFGAVNMTGMGV